MVKKAAPKTQEDNTYAVRDLVLAKIRGYPAWPGMVVDADSVPAQVAKERPSGKKNTFYCVRFFPAGDYAWIVPKDISRLQKHEIEAYINEPYRKSGDLLEGYKIALNPEDWEKERENAALEEEAKAADEEVDQLDSEGEDGEKKAKSKKRKRESEPANKAKAKPKAKKGSAEPAAAKKKATGKGRKNGSKANAMVESEDEGAAEAEGEEDDAGPSKESAPPAKKAKSGDEDVDPEIAKDPEAIKVKEWRHKLQKGFLGKTTPKPEEMPPLDELFTAVETYDKMSIQYLQYSKIGKVMRHIYILPNERVPRDDEFKFRERAKTLVDKWHDILNSTKPANGAPASDKAEKAETAPFAENGTADKVEGDVKMAEATPKPEEKPQEGDSQAPAATEAATAEESKANGTVENQEAKDVTPAPAAGDVSMLSEPGDVQMTE